MKLIVMALAAVLAVSTAHADGPVPAPPAPAASPVPAPRAGSFTIGGIVDMVDELFKSKKAAAKCKPYGGDDIPQMCS